MPEYKEPILSRQLQSFAEILKFYPEFPENRQKWSDRVRFDVGDGNGLRTLSAHWGDNNRTWLRRAIWMLGILGCENLRPAFCLARKRQDRVPKHSAQAEFTKPDAEESTTVFTNSANEPSPDSAA